MIILQPDPTIYDICNVLNQQSTIQAYLSYISLTKTSHCHISYSIPTTA